MDDARLDDLESEVIALRETLSVLKADRAAGMSLTISLLDHIAPETRRVALERAVHVLFKMSEEPGADREHWTLAMGHLLPFLRGYKGPDSPNVEETTN